MKNKISLIHCADLHLDAPFTGLGHGSVSQERRNDLKEVFEKIIFLVQENNADYLVISGDLFEHHYVRDSTIHWLNRQFKKIADKQCILIQGNHDPFVSNSWYRSYPWHDNVRILTTNVPGFMDEQKGVYFYGIGFNTFRQEQLPALVPPQITPDRINICLFHGTLDMSFTQSPYNPIDRRTLTDLGFDYYAMGHFHRKNTSYANEGIVNAGSPEPLGFDEPGEHGVFLVSLEKEAGQIRREIQFLPIQKRFYQELELNIPRMEPGFQLQDELMKLLECCNPEKDIIKISIGGRATHEHKMDIISMEEYLRGICFHIQLEDLTEPDYDLDALSEESNITGVFIRMMREKMDRAGDTERRNLEKALYLGLDAIFKGHIELDQYQ